MNDAHNLSLPETSKVDFLETLFWYDSPVVYSIRSERGIEFVMAIDTGEKSDLFASVVVPEDEIEAIKTEYRELRSYFEGNDKEVRLFEWTEWEEKSVFIRYQDLEGEMPEKWLSEPGASLVDTSPKDPYSLING